MKENPEINALKATLERFRKNGKILLAYLYGSYAKGSQHKRPDIDLAIYINTTDEKEAVLITEIIY